MFATVYVHHNRFNNTAKVHPVNSKMLKNRFDGLTKRGFFSHETLITFKTLNMHPVLCWRLKLGADTYYYRV